MQNKGVAHNLVDYIQTSIGNNNQYIVIDYIPNRKSKIVVDYAPESLGIVFYASKSAYVSRCLAIHNAGNIYFATGEFYGDAPSFEQSSGERGILSLDFYKDRISLTKGTYVDERILSAQSSSYDMLAVDECIDLHIFKRLDNNAQSYGLKIYSIKLYEEDKLLYDLNPFDDGDKNGLVNMLTGKTYCDENGGLFISPITT